MLISYSTSAMEDIGITHVLSVVNAERATRGLQALTAAQYTNLIIQEAFKSYADQERARREAELEDAYRNAVPAVRSQVRTLLGL